VRWNYDPFYLSQATDDHALREARERCAHNFLDPNFESRAKDAEATEYYHDLVANFGWEEAVAGQQIQECIKVIVAIAKISPFRQDYANFFKGLIGDVDLLESKEETKREVKSWLANAVDDLSKP